MLRGFAQSTAQAMVADSKYITGTMRRSCGVQQSMRCLGKHGFLPHFAMRALDETRRPSQQGSDDTMGGAKSFSNANRRDRWDGNTSQSKELTHKGNVQVRNWQYRKIRNSHLEKSL